VAQRQDKARYRAHQQREFDSAALDQILGDIDKQPQLAEVYRRLAIVEEQHAAFWGDKLRALGARVPLPRLSWRGQLRCLLAKRFGPTIVLPMRADIETTDLRCPHASHRRLTSGPPPMVPEVLSDLRWDGIAAGSSPTTPIAGDLADDPLGLAGEELHELGAIRSAPSGTGIPTPTRLIGAIVAAGDIVKCPGVGHLSTIQ
jgi:hypothetical protein